MEVTAEGSSTTGTVRPSDWIVREWWIGCSTTRAADNMSLGMAVGLRHKHSVLYPH